ncbi:MAG: PSD1 domain-containing protein [Verrucomicrobiaceae bacterium]|nr:PSD1 domain-containing protein [Verrucomicrobiaceae bacterium]
MFVRSIIAWAGLPLALASAAPFPPDQVEFFEKQVRPLLAERCYDCHGSHRHENGLRLDSRDGVIRGSDYGPVVKAGDPNNSKLLKAVKHAAGVEAMPKKGAKLNATEVAALEKWITLGVPWPEEKAVVAAKSDKPHWAFQKVPPVKPGTTLDGIVDAKLVKAGLKRAEQAPADLLCRRIYLAITGLPPTWEQMQAFVKDAAPDRTQRLVDELLKSPRFGERWSRYWLDVARYSDTEGYQVAGKDIRYPFAYTYRDWVIQALNDDMPYDQFITRQLAADRLEGSPDSPHLAALGFLTVGDTFIGSRDLQIDDRIDVVTRGILGLSVGCARCHDHKYDPIPSKDYYSLYSVFNSSQMPDEFPVIGRSKDAAAAAAYDKAAGDIHARITGFKAQVHSEIRTSDAIVAYLKFVRDAQQQNWPENEFRGKAGQAKLRDRVATRWQRLLAQESPVSVALIRMAALKDAEFGAKAPEVRAALLSPGVKVNDAVRNELDKRGAPKSFNDIARIYGDVFAAALSGQVPNNPAWDEVKAYLKRPTSPMSLEVDNIDDLFTRKDAESLVKLRNELKKLDVTAPGAPPRAMVMYDKPKPDDVSVFIRGNPARRGAAAPRGNLTALGGQRFNDGSGRLELARAITGRDNPLTARVFVNRVWMQLFGAPLVNQPSDFGVQTPSPEQLELLDYLSARFMDEGWSVKKLIKTIVTSGTYSQSSATTPEKELKDAENALLSRFKRLRLDYESMRDAVNATAGTLDLSTVGGRPVDFKTEAANTRRTVYHFVDRYEQPTVPAMFDFANPDSHSPQRYTTTVPQQALFLMNSPFMASQAARITQKSQTVEALYQRILLRNPKPEERARAEQFIAQSEALLKEPSAVSWRYGWSPVIKEGNAWKLQEFKPMSHYNDKRQMWTPGPEMPMKPWGHLLIRPNGGHPGANAAAVMQWTSPFSAKIAISGQLKRDSDQGNGVRVLILSSRQGMVKEIVTKPNDQVSVNATLNVERGEVISFVVDANDGNTNNDGYSWVPRIDQVDESGKRELITAADRDFCDAQGWPFNRAKPQQPLSQLAQVLLMSNEFMFVD